jgi:hypothetical protein
MELSRNNLKGIRDHLVKMPKLANLPNSDSLQW